MTISLKSHSFKPGEPIELIVGSMLNGQLFHGVTLSGTITITENKEYLVTMTYERREDGKAVQKDKQHLPLAQNQWLHERLGAGMKDLPFSFRLVPSP